MRGKDAELRSGSWRDVTLLAPILAIAAAFLVSSALTLDDFGLTWDEGVKMYDDTSYLEIVRRIEPYDPMVLHLPGYFYAFDTLRSLYAKAVLDLLPAAHPVTVHHSFNVLVSTGCLILVYGLVLRIAGERRFAALSALVLWLMPQFLGHSQNNPKDLPATFCFLWVAYAVVSTSLRPSARRVAHCAIAFGVAFTTRILSVLLVPILVPWLALRRRESLREGWRGLALGVVGGGLVGIGLWPALWWRGAGILEIAARRLEVLRGLDVQVLYLGEPHSWTALPWHYTGVQLLITLPLLPIVLIGLSPCAGTAWRRSHRSRCDVLWLGWLWVGVLLLADPFAPLHYDGIRHVLPVLPGLAMLAAGGALWAVEALEGALAPRFAATAPLAAWAIAALALLATLVEVAALHPYQSAYLNPIANAIGSPRTEEWVEVEYWGGSYKEAADWLNRHAPEDALVYFPIGGGQRSGEDVAQYYLRRRIARRGTLEQFRDTSTPRYLVFITRSAWYDDMIRDVRAHYEPVYAIRRQRGTLLEIYANRPAAGAE